MSLLLDALNKADESADSLQIKEDAVKAAVPLATAQQKIERVQLVDPRQAKDYIYYLLLLLVLLAAVLAASLWLNWLV